MVDDEGTAAIDNATLLECVKLPLVNCWWGRFRGDGSPALKGRSGYAIPSL